MDPQELEFNPILYTEEAQGAPPRLQNQSSFGRKSRSASVSANRERTLSVENNGTNNPNSLSPRDRQGSKTSVAGEVRDRVGSKSGRDQNIDIESHFGYTAVEEQYTNIYEMKKKSETALRKILVDRQKNKTVNIIEYREDGTDHRYSKSMLEFLNILLRETEDVYNSIGLAQSINAPTSTSAAVTSNSSTSSPSSSSAQKEKRPNVTVANKSNIHSSTSVNDLTAHATANEAKAGGKKSLLTVKNRDLRRLEPPLFEEGDMEEKAWDPTIFVRRHCVLFSIEPVRVVIIHNKCYCILEVGGGDSIQAQFEKKLNSKSGETGVSFEVRAYEAVLQTAIWHNKIACRICQEEISDILAVFSIASVIPFEKQEEMRQMKDKIAEKIAKVIGSKDAIESILDYDDELALLNLSILHQKPHLYTLPLSNDILVFHEEMEILLETYSMEFSSIENKLKKMQQQLKNASESVSLRLDTSRNQLLIADTCVSVISLCIAIGSYVGSIMGMNLRNNNETDYSTFSYVTGCTTGGITILALIILILFKYQGILPSELTPMDKFKRNKKHKSLS